jgi:3-deoxy-D-arabino-heptulosonate 7-phosphate (DAHP) synthase
MRNLAIFGPCQIEDPVTYDEAAKFDTWRKAMDSEIHAIKRNNTW